jgi:DNA-binding NarL/FixJ family response regulator
VLLVARGHSNGEVGERQVVTEATVKSYVGRIPAKLKLHSRVQIVVFVYENGFVSRGER